MTSNPRLLLLVACLALTCAPPVAAYRPDACAPGYSYAGVESPTGAYGVSARLKALTAPVVATGHVAAWVGVGGPGLGPGGSDEWLQAGIARDAGGDPVVYYEYKRPNDEEATSITVAGTRPGQSHTFVVYERAAHRDTWRVLVDGVKVGAPVGLPGSHGTFQPIATAESWDGGVAGTCNGFRFDFSNLAVRSGYEGTWRAFALSRVLRAPQYALALRASGLSHPPAERPPGSPIRVNKAVHFR